MFEVNIKITKKNDNLSNDESLSSETDVVKDTFGARIKKEAI